MYYGIQYLRIICLQSGPLYRVHIDKLQYRALYKRIFFKLVTQLDLIKLDIIYR